MDTNVWGILSFDIGTKNLAHCLCIHSGQQNSFDMVPPFYIKDMLSTASNEPELECQVKYDTFQLLPERVNDIEHKMFQNINHEKCQIDEEKKKYPFYLNHIPYDNEFWKVKNLIEFIVPENTICHMCPPHKSRKIMYIKSDTIEYKYNEHQANAICICSGCYTKMTKKEKHKYESISGDLTSYHQEDFFLRITLYLENLTQRIEQYTQQYPNFQMKAVAIEKQPPTNAKMRIVSNLVYQYFLMKKYGYMIEKKTHPIWKNTTIELISAKYKLRFYNGPSIDCSFIKKKYNKNKYLAIQYTQYFLFHFEHPTLLEYFHTHKKKDDLSDCFLQALAYIKLKKL